MTMQTKAATALYDYWTRQRGNRAVPLRADIEPGALAAILPDVFILEHSRLHDPRFRLAGTRICAQFARELKGTGFDTLFAPELHARIARITENVMAHRTPAVMQVELVDGGLETTEAEIVLLPMATRGRTADRIIGTFAPLPGQRPPISAFRHATLGSLSVIEQALPGVGSDGRPGLPMPTSIMPTSIMAMRPAALGQTVGRVLHLRIFEGGEGGKTSP
jgi:hypothetical protein